jgi:ATP-dependent RNA helicase HelY
MAPPKLPRGQCRQALTETVDIWARIDGVERDHQVDFQREPDLGFAWATYRWATGHRLETVLADADLPAGDFVRWTKQLIDLLGQIAEAVGGEGDDTDTATRATAHAAADALRRGVVAYSSVG